VIASRASGGIADTLLGGGGVLLTDGGSATALAFAMLRMARNPALRADIAQRVYSAARSEFSIARVLAAYSELYERAAA
jgi:glycosyltransferase involved in cell wall biosynthesis